MTTEVFHRALSEPAAAEPPAGSTEPATPTVTFYQQRASAFLKDVTAVMATLPKIEPRSVSTAFVRTHLAVPPDFMAGMIAQAEQSSDLRTAGQFDVAAARNIAQLFDAYAPVIDRLESDVRAFRFTLNAARANLAAETLHLYAIARVMQKRGKIARDVVQQMRRALGRKRPRTKAGPPASTPPITTAQ